MFIVEIYLIGLAVCRVFPKKGLNSDKSPLKIVLICLSVNSRCGCYSKHFGIQGTTRIEGSFSPFRIATFRSKGVSDSINLELTKAPTLRGRKLDMSEIKLETNAIESGLSPAT